MNKQRILLLICLMVVLSIAEPLLAADEQIDAKSYLNKWLAIASGFALAIAAAGGAYAQGKSIYAAMEGIARNPGSADSIRGLLIIGLAFIESLVIYTLLISLILLFFKWVK